MRRSYIVAQHVRGGVPRDSSTKHNRNGRKQTDLCKRRIVYSVRLFGTPEGPTILRAVHDFSARRDVKSMEIKPVDSELATTLCLRALEDGYGEDVHREIWPVSKEVR